jgi:hypothetical protein
MPENDTAPDTNVNLWAEVGNLCLLKSISLLKDGPCTMNTIKEVKALVEIATAIDTQNLCWETKCKDKNPFVPQSTKLEPGITVNMR